VKAAKNKIKGVNENSFNTDDPFASNRVDFVDYSD
jgi:hypothetical protein